MDTLRLILLLVGAAVIGAIYLHWTTTRGAKRALDDDDDLPDPYVDEFDGPRVRRRGGAAPPLGEIERFEPPPVAETPAADAAPAVVEPAPETARAPARTEHSDAGPGSASIGSETTVDIDDLDAIAAARPDRASVPVLEPTLAGARDPDAAAPDPAPEQVVPPVGVQPERADHAQEPSIGSLAGLTATSEPGPKQLDLAGITAQGGGDAPREPAVAPEVPGEPEMVIVLTVMARQGRELPGAAVRSALELVGLVFGDMEIYHRTAVGQRGQGAPVFSVANIRNPGTLDPEHSDEMTTPGLALFMRVPGPVDAASAFQQMLEAGRRVAERLDAVLCDETRSTLTTQSVNHIRERIAEYARQRLITGRR